MFKIKYFKGITCRCQVWKRNYANKKMSKDTKKYTKTINLPITKFQVWIKPFQRSQIDEHIQKVCNFSELYSWQRENIQGEEYVLHDGPPYANGHPHMGHAINKILKDVTIRSKLLQGRKIHYKPGWDCHGLPIELMALSKTPSNATNKLSPIDIRNKARKFASDAINNQRAVFKSWAVMADWSDQGCYFTYDKDYVKNEMQQFFNLYEKGLVYRDFKPVYWSPSSKTALAEAELEYNNDHVSKSLTFSVKLSNLSEHIKTILSKYQNRNLYALVWTTTPWTLPGNQAIAYNPSLDYSIIEIDGDNKLYILATAVVKSFSELIKRKCHVIDPISVDDISTLKYTHPISDIHETSLPFLPAHHVTAEKGTGLVHTACAFGHDDFLIGKKNGLNIESIVDEEGNYTEKAGAKLCGLNVLSKECTNKVISMLKEDCIMNIEDFKHSYPYDWRTKQPVIIRASQQWFIDTNDFKQKAINSLDSISMVPERNSTGFISFLESRPYWCISRQRVWGVPIPVLYNKSDESTIINKSLIERYGKLMDEHGTDFWWKLSLDEIIPKNLAGELKIDINNVEKGQDILDIWLDSGLSWSYVLGENKVADMYLEGVDQFAGWFQSSLLTSIALQGKAPYKSIYVHGFAVDEKGHKMSKSLGNVINPQGIIHGGTDKTKDKPRGIDVLRWWVAGHAQHVNVPVSETSLADSLHHVQRLRSVLRYLVGSIYDFEEVIKSTDEVKLFTIDKYTLHLLYHFHQEVTRLYNSHQYYRVVTHIINFVANEISSLYVFLTKDRLYCDAVDSNERRAVLITLNHMLNVLLNVIAPIVPVLAEEVYMYHPLNKGNETFFTNLKSYNVCDKSWVQPEIEEIMKVALDLRKLVIKETPINSVSWTLSAELTVSPKSYDLIKVLQDTETSSNSELVELLKMSPVTLLKDPSLTEESDKRFKVKLRPIDGILCDRCRSYAATIKDGDCEICKRCSDILDNIAKSPVNDKKKSVN